MDNGLRWVWLCGKSLLISDFLSSAFLDCDKKVQWKWALMFVIFSVYTNTYICFMHLPSSMTRASKIYLV